MRCAWGKVILVLVVVVGVLQVIHMLLLSRLELRQSGLRRIDEDGVTAPGGASLSSASLHESWVRDLEAMDAAVGASSVLDPSGEFKVVNFLAHADARASRHDVTLVSQCSQDRLWQISLLVRRWQGPMAIAVFATGDRLWTAVKTVATLRQCVPGVRSNVSFHLVHPVGQAGLKGTAVRVRDAVGSDKCDCSSLVDEQQRTRTNYAWGDKVVYPNNLLRNVGRRNAATEFVFVVDVDMVPNVDLHDEFLEFARAQRLFDANRRDDKTVYVVPAFEAREGTPVPRDKTDLLHLLAQVRVRPFYFKLCWKCQGHTDYEAWQREPPAPQLAVLFEVLWKDPWEPFYIARNNVPLYDERFKQYGFNRISQVCELHIAGYKFSILNNAFLVHWGLKTTDSFHARKDEDQERNRLLFRQFKTELKDKYPDSSRRCY
uniref:Beta-1,4-glucuronyltransferase 1 n=1 Tax=Strigamia maritima TaxID=126957 RepID=T1J8L2_STRMM